MKLRAVETCGGPVLTLATAPYFSEGFAQDATTLFFGTSVGSGQGAIVSVPKAGGPATTLAQGELRPSGIAIDDTSSVAVSGSDVFAAGQEGVWKIPVAGGAPELVFSQSTLAVRATGSYVVLASPYGIFSLDVSDGTTKRLSDGGNSVCASASGVAFASGEIVAVHRVPLLGGIDDIVIASGATGPGVVACDATAAYWAGGGQITRSSVLR